MFSNKQDNGQDYQLSSNHHPSLTLNFDDDNDNLLSSPCCCSSPKFTSPPTSPATTASSTSSSLECSSLSDGGFSTSASSNTSSQQLSPLPTTPTLPASPLTTSSTQQQSSLAALPAIPPQPQQQQPLALTRTNSEKLEAENAVLTNACLGLLELLNSQRGGNPGNTTTTAAAAYNALLSRVGGAATSNGSNGHQALLQQQQQQAQPTLAAPLPSFSFPAATGIPRPQGNTGINDMSTTNSSNMGSSCYGRRKSYGAPPGVWRNPYGYVSTVYVNKKRVYGPLRKTIEDASRDREAMVQAKEYVTSVEEMRAFVREFLKPNPHGGVAESAVLPNLPTLEDEMLVTL
ncbi:Intraflagellar transport protein 56 [Perkinsus chesapeaki]|uniref:Intraflagellar transport protein 56 n=1 Tax=Perkinsus chesapeaki TaxID=330153 RepID=A0A7J6N297_PERCH|nr:Intraflagellar transport protein 56 [Perkinsus chesapeaki]